MGKVFCTEQEVGLRAGAPKDPTVAYYLERKCSQVQDTLTLLCPPESGKSTSLGLGTLLLPGERGIWGPRRLWKQPRLLPH